MTEAAAFGLAASFGLMTVVTLAGMIGAVSFDALPIVLRHL